MRLIRQILATTVAFTLPMMGCVAAEFTLDPTPRGNPCRDYPDNSCGCEPRCCDCTHGWEYNDCETFPREWLKRVDLELFFPEYGKSSGWIDTIQPLCGSDRCCEQTLFIQTRTMFETADARYCRHDDLKSFSAGIGYRRLVNWRGCWQVGLNHFWDWYDGHHRYSIGAEAIGEIVTFRANYYDTVSGKKKHIVSPSVTEYSKSLDGWDIGAESQVPYLPWLHAIVRYYNWNGDRISDTHGWELALHGELTTNSYFELGSVSNQDDNAFALKLGFRLGRPQSVTNNLCDGWYSCCRWTPQNLCCLQLQKVRRTHWAARECTVDDKTILFCPEIPVDENDEYFD